MRFLLNAISLLVLWSSFGQTKDSLDAHIGARYISGSSPSYQISGSIGQLLTLPSTTAATDQYSFGWGRDEIGPFKSSLQSLGDQYVTIGSRLELVVEQERFDETPVFSFQVIENEPNGVISFDGATRQLTYHPTEQDINPTVVEFTETYSDEVIIKRIRISTLPAQEPVFGEDFGYLAGNFSVSESGSASYTIPLKTPPGAGGLKPELSITYSSSGSNGMLGVGFGMSGLSAINIAQRNLQDDGVVRFDFDNVSYELDGERLVSIKDSPDENQAEYRTEQNNFSKIQSFTSGGKIDYFLIHTKSGLIKEYGRTIDSKVDGNRLNSKPFFWAVNKISDTNGNYINFTYEESPDQIEYYPKRIEYGGNTEAGVQTSQIIEFDYEIRPDANERYFDNIKIVKKRRLKEIRIISNSTVIRRYSFDYTFDVRSKLTAIHEIGSDDKSLRPTRFNWQETTNFGFTHSGSPFSTSAFNKDTKLLAADLNKDVKVDIILYDTETGSTKVYLNQGNGQFEETSLDVSIGAKKEIFFQDLNLDGATDIVVWNKTTGQFSWILNRGNGSFYFYAGGQPLLNYTSEFKQGELSFSDVNSDAQPDLFWYNKETGSSFFYVAASNDPNETLSYQKYTGPSSDYFKDNQVNLNDLNGDGLPEIVIYESKDEGGDKVRRLNYLLNTSTSLNLEFNDRNLSTYISSDTLSVFKKEIQPRVGDWNGDGLSDYMWVDPKTGENFWYLNLGDPAPAPIQVINPINPSILKSDSAVLYLNDWDKDGLIDVVWQNYVSGETKWYTNKGNFVFSLNGNVDLLDTMLIKQGSGLVFGDWTGNGAGSVLWYNNRDGVGTMGANNLFINDLRNENLLTKITQGNGYEVDISYGNMSDTTLYRMGTNSVFPEQDFIGSIDLVRTYEVSNGVGGKNRFEYQYQGGIFHVQGRGFRGFNQVEIVDINGGLKNVMMFNRDYRYLTNQIVEERQESLNGDLLSKTTYVNELQNDYTQNDTHFSFVKEKVSETYELDGSLITQLTERKSYDTYGNPLKVVIDYGDGHVDSTANEYSNNEDLWLLGRLTSLKLFRKLPDGSFKMRESSFEYHPITGLLTKEILEPNVDSLKLVTEYVHDDFGNRIQVTIQGNNGAEEETRSEVTSYDETGRFSVEAVNAIGHAETRAYDNTWGNVTSHTGPNELSTQWEFDGFGRTIKEVRPDRTTLTKSYKWCGDSFECPPTAIYGEVAQLTGSPTTINYYDLLDREVRSLTYGYEGKKIIIDKEYDSRGKMVRMSEPYYEGDNIIWTEYEYDLKRRATRITQPGDRISTMEYRGLVTVEQNPNNQTSEKHYNALDRIIQVTDAIGSKLSYEYDEFGNLISLTDPLGNSIEYEFDIRGNKIKMIDPDLGTRAYKYNAFSELIEKTDDKQNQVTYAYDNLGRISSRNEPEGTTTWAYDEGNKGIGKVSDITSFDITEEFEYDDLGRLAYKKKVIGPNEYEVSNEYDQFSRVTRLIYPSGFKVDYLYDEFGYLETIKDTEEGTLYWQLNEVTARGQIASQAYGNEVVTRSEFDYNTGWLERTYAHKDQDTLQHFSYTFDLIGNLTSRADDKFKLSEAFTYDELNRLTDALVEGSTALEMQYDAIGNITFKSDVGSYSYGENGAGPHAVSGINGEGVENWSLAARLQEKITYTSFDKTSEIALDTSALQISYSYNYQRISWDKYIHNQLVETKYYVDNIYEEVARGDSIEQVHYIRSPEGVIATRVQTASKDDARTIYWHKDHLGSLTTLSNDSANVMQRLSYDPWGRRRNAETWIAYELDYDQLIARGFTGHEHYDLLSFIDMNGRIYDPLLGRFTSADPNIPDLLNLQSLNRYAYVINNPLSYTDPSGFFFKKILKAVGKFYKGVGKFIKKHSKIIIPVVVGLATMGIGSAIAVGLGAATGGLVAGVASAAGFGFGFQASSTVLSGGSIGDALKAGLKAGVISGLTAVATFGVGELFDHATTLGNIGEKIVAHGGVQGISTELQGGEFKHGFMSGGFSAFAAPSIEQIASRPAQLAASAIAGGVGSEIGGGKFVNGAISGATVLIYNQWAGDIYGQNAELLEKAKEADKKVNNIDIFNDSNSELFRKVTKSLKDNGFQQTFDDVLEEPVQRLQESFDKLDMNKDEN